MNTPWLRSFGLALAVTLPLLGSPSWAQEEISVTGEIVDLSCYLTHGGKGRSHRTCAQQCAKRGLPIGVLAENGDLYLLIEDHANGDPYEAAKGLAGDKAAVKGKKFVKAGMNSLLVGEVKGQ